MNRCHARRGGTFLLATFTLVPLVGAQALATDSCTGRETLPELIRSSDCRIVARIAEGLRRSSTLRDIVDRIGELKGIVYVDEGSYRQPNTGRVLTGALSHEVRFAGVHTILRVRIANLRGDQTIATLGHELQHAVEVLEVPGARDEAAIDALFDRLGARVYDGIAETARARETELRIRRELAATRPSR